MATSISDQVSSLLSLTIAEPKTQGLPSSNIESAAVLESIATNLLVYPRTILYVAHLARQGLQAAAQAELTQIQTVLADVVNMGNPSYAITDTSDLTDAQTALLQIQDNQNVSVKNNSFSRLSASVNSFLSTQLAPNVKVPGATSLTVPAAEAGSALAADYASLQSMHSELLALLYALGVGVQNFAGSPISTIIGTAAAARVSADIQDIIDSIEEDNSGAGSSDFTNRLIADKAVLQTLGTPVNYTLPKISTQQSLPVGYSIEAVSNPAPISVAGTEDGPFSGFLSSGNLTFQLTTPGLGTVTIVGNDTNVLQSLDNPAIYGNAVAYPIDIPTNSYLFLTLTALSTLTGWTQQADLTWTQSTVGGGWQKNPASGLYTQTFQVDLPTGSAITLAQVLTAIQASVGGYNPWQASTGTPFVAVQFAQPTTNQILIYASGTKYQSISIAAAYTEPVPQSALTEPGAITTYTNSFASQLGFSNADQGFVNQVPSSQIVDALNAVLAGVATVSLSPATGSINLVTMSSYQGISLTLSGAWAAILGLSGSFQAQSSTISLQGTVLGVETNPVSPQGLMDPGDVLVLPTGNATVASVGTTSFTITPALSTFQPGNITVTSALYLAWQVLNTNVQAQVAIFLNSGFASGTGRLDAAIAALAGAATPGTINAAKNYLNSMTTLIQGLATALTASGSLLPLGSAQTEMENSAGIVQTLTERGYDKALDYYMMCNVSGIFTMDYQTASYAGAFMTAAQAVSQNDVNYPNTALDEGLGSSGFQPNRPGTP
jgi:hypothetical protein